LQKWNQAILKPRRGLQSDVGRTELNWTDTPYFLTDRLTGKQGELIGPWLTHMWA